MLPPRGVWVTEATPKVARTPHRLAHDALTTRSRLDVKTRSRRGQDAPKTRLESVVSEPWASLLGVVYTLKFPETFLLPSNDNKENIQ